MIGLLMLTSIPAVTGISLGISERSKPETLARERAQMRKFTLTCWCAGKSTGKSAIHGGDIVLGDNKMWIQARSVKPSKPFYPFDGFYLDYPDEERTPPPPTGLVTMVSDSPPLMNWIYIEPKTWLVRHGNRTESRPCWVGNWGWTSMEEEDMATEPGGLMYEGDEKFVAVAPRKGSVEEKEGRWEIRWDEEDDRLEGWRKRGGAEAKELEGRVVLRVSLERAYLEEEVAVGGDKDGKAGETGVKRDEQVSRRIIKPGESAKTTAPGGNAGGSSAVKVGTSGERSGGGNVQAGK